MLSSVKISYQHLLIELPFLMVCKAYWPWHLLYLQSSKQLNPYIRRSYVGVYLCLWVCLIKINLQHVLKYLFTSDLPHRLMEDDVYKDMHIPKGSLVFGNIWYVNVLLCFPFACRPFFRFIQSSVVPISYSTRIGQWCAMKRYILMLPLSVLNDSWCQLHLKWNARWIQKILCLGLAEGEFLTLV